MGKDTRSELQHHLHGVRRRWATLVWLQVGARVCLVVAAVVAAATIVDRWLSPDGVPLLLLAIVVALAALRQLYRLADLAASAEPGRSARRSICRGARSGARRHHRDGCRSRSSRGRARRWICADGHRTGDRAPSCARCLRGRASTRVEARLRSGRAWRGRAAHRVHPRGSVCGARAGGGAPALPARHDRDLGSAGRRADGRRAAVAHRRPPRRTRGHADARDADARGRVQRSGADDRDGARRWRVCRHHRSRGPFVRLSRARRTGGLTALFGDRAVSAAREAHRPSLRVSGVHGSCVS